MLVLAAPAALAVDFRLLVAWPADYLGVAKLAERYVRRVEAASSGEIRFLILGPDAVPAFDQLTPVALGIFDLVFTHGSFHRELTPMGVALDAIAADPARLREAGVWAAVDAHYQAHGLKLLALPAARSGYEFLLRDPIGADCTLTGRRIRASDVHHPLIEGLGAVPVTLAATEVDHALDSGAIAGLAWPTANVPEASWLDAIRFATRPSFGTFTHMLFINLATWQALSEAERTLLAREAVALEVRSWKRSPDYASRIDAELSRHGIQATALCGDTLARVPGLWAEGVWRGVLAQDDGTLAHLRDLARAAGITP